MARQTPAAVRPSKAGTAFALSAAPAVVDGDAIPPDAVLYVLNSSGSPITLTVVTPGVSADNLAIGDYTVTVPAGAGRLVGPFPDQVYVQQSGATSGLVHIDYSSTTTVTRAVIGGFDV